MYHIKMSNRAEGQLDHSSSMLNSIAYISDEIEAGDWKFQEFDHEHYFYVHRIYDKIQLVVYNERYDHDFPLSYNLHVKDGEDTFKDVDYLEEAIEEAQR